MAKIFCPNKEYSGVSAGVRFIDGVGGTDDPQRIAWFRENGYGVEEPAPEPEAQPQLDAADTQINPLVPDTGVNPRVPEMNTPGPTEEPFPNVPMKENENVPTVDGMPVTSEAELEAHQAVEAETTPVKRKAR